MSDSPKQEFTPWDLDDKAQYTALIVHRGWLEASKADVIFPSWRKYEVKPGKPVMPEGSHG